MVLTMLNYQVDEIVRSIVARLGHNNRHRNPKRRAGTCRPFVTPANSFKSSRLDHDSLPRYAALEDVVEVLSKYIRHVNRLCRTTGARLLPGWYSLGRALSALCAVCVSRNPPSSSTTRSWGVVRPLHAAANDTSCSFSFAFFCCLISPSG